jgi:hypothetical protein
VCLWHERSLFVFYIVRHGRLFALLNFRIFRLSLGVHGKWKSEYWRYTKTIQYIEYTRLNPQILMVAIALRSTLQKLLLPLGYELWRVAYDPPGLRRVVTDPSYRLALSTNRGYALCPCMFFTSQAITVQYYSGHEVVSSPVIVDYKTVLEYV